MALVSPTPVGAIPGHLLVSFKGPPTEQAIAGIAEGCSLQVLGGSGVFRILKTTTDLAAAVECLHKDPRVASAALDSFVNLTAIPDDPFPAWYAGKSFIDAEGAWDIETGSGTAVLAIIDSGLDLTSPDILPNIFLNEGELPAKWTARDSSGRKFADLDGDGLITFHDFSTEPANIPALNSFIAAVSLVDVNANRLVDCDDLRSPLNRVIDHLDNDGNGFADDLCGWNFAPSVSGDGTPTGSKGDNNPRDDFGHGTVVASIAGSVGNNKTGLAGIAWSIRILPIKTTSADNVTHGRKPTFDALDYAKAMKADVVNLSQGLDALQKNAVLPDGASCVRFSGARAPNAAAFDSQIQDVRSEWSMANVTVPLALDVADCPVDYSTNMYFTWPASLGLPNAVVSTATDRSDKVAAFAGFGANIVDLGAPGVNMLGATLGSSTPSLFQGAGNGTSFANPVVSATMILVGLTHPTLAGDGAALRDRLVQTADKTGIATRGGRLNVSRAVAP